MATLRANGEIEGYAVERLQGVVVLNGNDEPVWRLLNGAVDGQKTDEIAGRP